MMKAIVIGSGVSGLTAAATLAQAGYAVSVYEQFEQPGGVTAAYERDGYRWDLGQLMIEGLGPDEPVGWVLDQLGVREQIPVRREDRGYVFPDFELRKPEAYAGPRWRMDLLEKEFPGESKGLGQYWEDNLRFLRLMTYTRKSEHASGLAALVLKAQMYATLLPFLPKKDWSSSQLMDHYFQSEKLKMVFISILADFFTPPSQFIGLGVFALNTEVTFDHRIPKALAPNAEQIYQYSILGGVERMVQALVNKIEACGGKFYLNCPVVKIIVENGRVRGVIDRNGNREDADVIIASGGVRETFLELVGKEHLPEGYTAKVEAVPLMDSIFMVHLGLDFDPRPAVHGVVTYYYGTYDAEGEIARAKDGVYHGGKAGFVVHVPTLHSPGMAPEGQHAMTIYTICPDRLKTGSWAAQKEAYADQLINYAGQKIHGLSDHIVKREILTPDDFRMRTHLKHHAFGGLAPVMGAWRAPHKTPIEGLWFVGAQSESGGGVGAIIPAAYRTVQRILKES
jgi:all-trans-retinol 13,14-reductase